MSLPLVLSALVAFGIGLAFLCATWPPSVPIRPYRAVVATLAPGVGLGITAVGVFCWLVLVGPPDHVLVAVELGVLILLLAWIRRGKARRAPAGVRESTFRLPRPPVA